MHGGKYYLPNPLHGFSRDNNIAALLITAADLYPSRPHHQ